MEGHAQGAILDALELNVDRIGELDFVLLLFLGLFIVVLVLLALLFLFLQQLVLGFAEVEAVPRILGQERGVDVELRRPARSLVGGRLEA